MAHTQRTCEYGDVDLIDEQWVMGFRQHRGNYELKYRMRDTGEFITHESWLETQKTKENQ